MNRVCLVLFLVCLMSCNFEEAFGKNPRAKTWAVAHSVPYPTTSISPSKTMPMPEMPTTSCELAGELTIESHEPMSCPISASTISSVQSRPDGSVLVALNKLPKGNWPSILLGLTYISWTHDNQSSVEPLRLDCDKGTETSGVLVVTCSASLGDTLKGVRRKADDLVYHFQEMSIYDDGCSTTSYIRVLPKVTTLKNCEDADWQGAKPKFNGRELGDLFRSRQ